MQRLLLASAFVGLSTAAPLRHHHRHGGVLKKDAYDYEDTEWMPGTGVSGSPAHISDEGRRVDKCFAGLVQNIDVVSTRLPGAPANTTASADKLIGNFVNKIMSAAPQCYTRTGQDPQLSMDSGIVSEKYKLYFQTAAKVASQTAEAWMKCRFDGTHGPMADENYTRLMFVRNPAGRAISGYYQMVHHYMSLLKLPPAKLKECAQAFPEEAKWPSDTAGTHGWPINSFVVSAIEAPDGTTCAITNRSAVSAADQKLDAAGGLEGKIASHVGPIVGTNLPQHCSEAWNSLFTMVLPKRHAEDGTMPTKAEMMAMEKHLLAKFWPDGPKGDGLNPNWPICAVSGLSLNATMNAANSHLYNAMWKLPGRCRLPTQNAQVLGTNETLNMTFREIMEYENLPSTLCPEGETCDEECVMSDYTFASLFSAGLSDTALMRSPGCSGELFAGEHMWSMMTHLSPIGRVDAMLRLEDLKSDSVRFEQMVEKKLGITLPEVPDTCDIEQLSYINNNQDLDSGVARIPFHDVDRLKEVIDRSPDLQRRLCALYYHDFVCLGYELLDACKGEPDEWLDGALDDLMKNKPLEKLHHKSKRVRQDLGHLFA